MARQICSDPEDGEREIAKLRSILAQNQYPEYVVERYLQSAQNSENTNEKFKKNRLKFGKKLFLATKL